MKTKAIFNFTSTVSLYKLIETLICPERNVLKDQDREVYSKMISFIISRYNKRIDRCTLEDYAIKAIVRMTNDNVINFKN